MLRKHLILLALSPIMIVACGGGSNTSCKLDKGYVGYRVSDTDGGEYKYRCVDFSFWIKDGKNKKITKNNFYAKVNNVKVNPICIFSSVRWHNYFAYYESIVESKELIAGTTTYITQSHGFVGFALDSGIDENSKYYVNNVEVNTDREVNIKL